MLHSLKLGSWIWLVPFLVSIPFFNSEGSLKIDFAAFKVVMAACIIGSTVIANRNRTVTLPSAWGAVVVAGTFDFVVLGLLLRQPLVMIATQVVPFYLVVPAVIALMKPKSQNGGKNDGREEEELAR